MQPTIVTNIKSSNPAFKEEFFGPVASFFRVKNEDEAVALANRFRVWSRRFGFYPGCSTGKTCREPDRDGHGVCQSPDLTAPDLPFGGIKNSGYGRELSSMEIEEFVNKKLVRVASIDAPA